MTDHDRFDALALGHVLGGLEDGDAAEFRTHLLSCRVCRRRVSELRGIAADLESAEREERAQLRLKTETPDEPPKSPDSERRDWSLRPRMLVAMAVGIAIVAGVMLYVLHLRSANDTLLATTEVRESVLRELGQGEPLAAELASGVTGVLSSDGDEVAFSLAGLPALQRRDVVVVWRVVDGEASVADSYPASAVPGGLLAGVVAADGADRVVISVEDEPVDRPGPHVLAEAPMPAPDGG